MAPPSARNGILYQPLTQWETLVVTGPDRCSWLDGLVTCDVKELSPGQGNWGLILNRQGKIQTVVFAIQTQNELWLAVAPGTAEDTFSQLDGMLIMEDAELALPEEPQAWFALHGPESLDRAKQLVQTASDDTSCCAELDQTLLGGAIVRTPEANASRLTAQMGSDCLSEEAWTQLRLERGLPSFNLDISDKDRPHEAGLERRAVCWTKGCYLGQEVVCTQDMRGKVKRSSRVVTIEAPADATFEQPLAIVDAAGESVGKVTSAAYSDRAESWLMMARLKLDKTSSAMFAQTAEGVNFPVQLSDTY